MNEAVIKFSRAIIWSLLIFQLILFIFNIPGLKVSIDEAWIGEQAYAFADHGYVKSEMFDDFLGYDERILIYHKAFIWAGAVSIKLFGHSLYSLRIVSILFGIILAGLLYLFCRKYYNITIFKIALVILLLCPLIFRDSITYRPEIMAASFGFASFFCLYKFLLDENKIFLILSAILAGFSALAHLNGIIFIGAGALLLLFEKKWIWFAVFSVMASAVTSLYLNEAVGNWELFGLQLQQGQSNLSDNFHWYMPVKNLLNEHKRLFRKPEIIGITSLFLLAAWYRFRNFPKERKYLLLYTFSLIILMGMINHNKTTKYAILMFPLFALMISENIFLLINDPPRLKSLTQKLFAVILVFTFAVGLHFSFNSILFGKEDWTERHMTVASHIPHGSTILAPMSFMYDEIYNYNIIGMIPSKHILDHEGKAFTAENVCWFAQQNKCEYMVIDHERRLMLGCVDGDTTCLEHSDYEYLISEFEFDIYKRGHSEKGPDQ